MLGTKGNGALIGDAVLGFFLVVVTAGEFGLFALVDLSLHLGPVAASMRGLSA